MKNRSWIAAAIATAGVVLGAALYIDALETGHTDGGLRADPRGVAPSASPSPTAGKGGKCVGSRPGPSGSDGESPDDTPLYRTLDRIDRLAAGRHSAVYTGMSVDEAHNAADVWRIPSAAFDADVCEAAEKGVTVRLHAADANRKDLDALADRIADDMKRWDGTFDMREVGVDERGFVLVGVDDPKKAEPLIEEEFGPRYIKVEHVEQTHADVG